MQSIIRTLNKNLEASIESKQALLGNASVKNVFAQAVRLIVDRYEQGGRLYIAGNGGSAADAQHIAAEFVSKLAKDRPPLAAEALTVDSSILTAIGNDYGYEQVFARQLRGKATPNDVFLGITTSGASPNILLALEACEEIGIPSVVLSGRGGGACVEKANYCIVAPGTATSTIQEAHIVLGHTLCEVVEQHMCFHNEAMAENSALA